MSVFSFQSYVKYNNTYDDCHVFLVIFMITMILCHFYLLDRSSSTENMMNRLRNKQDFLSFNKEREEFSLLMPQTNSTTVFKNEKKCPFCFKKACAYEVQIASLTEHGLILEDLFA